MKAARLIHRLTGGVVREVQRLMAQVQRVVRLNALTQMDPDVVLLASEGLFRPGRRKHPGPDRRLSCRPQNQ